MYYLAPGAIYAMDSAGWDPDDLPSGAQCRHLGRRRAPGSLWGDADEWQLCAVYRGRTPGLVEQRNQRHQFREAGDGRRWPHHHLAVNLEQRDLEWPVW